MGWRQGKPASVVSLDWQHDTLQFESVRKAGQGCRSVTQGSMVLPENVFEEDAETLGAALRTKLDAAGIKEKGAICSLPIAWLFGVRTEVPQLSGEDLEFFFQTQAERAFPLPLDELCISRSQFTSSEGKQHAFIMAIAVHRLDHLSRVMQAAGLQPLSWSLNSASPSFLQSLPEKNALCICSKPHGFDLIVVLGQRLALARSLSETDSSGQIAREVKISLGELDADIQASVDAFYHCAEWDVDEGAIPEITKTFDGLAKRLDLEYKSVSRKQTAALDLGADFLLNRANPFEFLPPKVSPFEEWTQTFSTGRNKWLGTATVAVVFTLCLLFFWKSQTLKGLEEEWLAMEEQVGELEGLQERIRLYRPWYDESIPSLKLIQHLTQAFPEQGEVWVRELEIRDASTVVCSGFARNQRAWLDMFEKLRMSPQVKDLTLGYLREDKQQEFSFQYRWEAKP
ncbi:hypothetical protein OAE97_02100 [Verrucomicrobia bacterium]|jgi:hypothetical protein|nr:hypothetical protein [Verrucomicrobiota bacterium]MDG1891446.1 hypothetical protein [Verrucomicrobiota bacterium]